METTVTVWGTKIEITVYQKSKTVWVASGEYLGKHHEVKRPTRGAAAKAWAETAKYHSG